MKTTPHIKFIFIAVCLLFITSCSPIFNGIYGFNKLQALSEAQILTQAKKLNIPSTQVYVLDSSFISYLKSFDSTTNEGIIKNHYQPLQMLYYNKSLQFCSFHANCFAGGFPNLNWNRQQQFSVFPPKTTAPLDTLFKVTQLLQYVKPIGLTQTENQTEQDYLILIFWNKFLGRQTKRMIEITQKNLELAKGKNIKVYYINNDNFFSKQDF